jgi:hypothetical protein
MALKFPVVSTHFRVQQTVVEQLYWWYSMNNSQIACCENAH